MTASTPYTDFELAHKLTVGEMMCGCGCGKHVATRPLLNAWERFRRAVGVPVFVNSGFRCEAHNRAVGGAFDSQHLKGNAVDFHLPTRTLTPDWIVVALLEAGFRGIGWGGTFVHADVRERETFWQYDRGVPVEWAEGERIWRLWHDGAKEMTT